MHYGTCPDVWGRSKESQGTGGNLKNKTLLLVLMVFCSLFFVLTGCYQTVLSARKNSDNRYLGSRVCFLWGKKKKKYRNTYAWDVIESRFDKLTGQLFFDISYLTKAKVKCMFSVSFQSLMTVKSSLSGYIWRDGWWVLVKLCWTVSIWFFS